MIDKKNRLPLYVQLKDYIMNNIKDGTYAKGSKIPTEKGFMDQFSLGRATVRAAILELEHEGYIIKRHGIGTFVADATKKMGFEPLISLSFSLNSMGLSSENFITENHIIEPDASLVNAAHLLDNSQLGHICRIRHADGMPIAIENSYLSMDLYKQVNQYPLQDSLADIILNKLDISISKIDQTIISRQLTDAEKTLLNVAGSPMSLELTRWLYDTNSSIPFYYISFVMLSDAMAYPFELFTKKHSKK